MRMKVGGVEITLIALRNATVTLQQAAPHVVRAGGRVIASQVRRRISLTDHTQADLDALDHPYARRHGAIRIHRRMPWQVHKQTGRMRDALEHGPITAPGGNPAYQVTFNYLRAPHAEDVIRGTDVMLPRDVLWRTAHEDGMDLKIMRAIVKVLGSRMRSKLGIRFDQGTSAGELFPTRARPADSPGHRSVG